MATQDPSAAGNPIPFREADYAEIARRALTGELARARVDA
jgi:hypothetical protein